MVKKSKIIQLRKNFLMKLSKSLYTRTIQYPKSLWLKKYKPEVLILPDAAAQAVFDTGSEVGELACGLFPGGVEVEFTREYDRMVEATARLLEEGGAGYL